MIARNKLIVVRRYIANEIDNLNKVQNEISVFSPTIGEEPSSVEIRASASMLVDFYKGVEKIFEKIARNIDQQLPKGEFWHSELLRQMSQEFGSARPPIVTQALSKRLDEYLRFRHLARNVYGFHLQWERIKPLLVFF